ncbi:MAG: hypothetical protein HRU09_14840 [Oligoflexales bacterium]|nr:hypothetical protein [Oligoflexales bacterium]
MRHKLVFVLFTLMMEATQSDGAYFNPTSDFKQEKKASLTLGIIWEGQDLVKHNLQALKEIRQHLPNIKVIQFLSPAYLTKPGVNQEQTLQKIKETIGKDDIIGLHLQPWRSFTQDAGVLFRTQPTFWGNQLANDNDEWGHEVPLSIYTQEEILKMIKHSQKLFSKHGISSPSIFMAGGWMAAPHVLEAVRQSGILFDSSAVAIDITERKLRFYPLFKWLKNIWGSIKPPFQPFLSQTEAGPLGQLVLNGGIPHYISSGEIKDRFTQIVNTTKPFKNDKVHFHLAIHQETAWETQRSLVGAINQLRAYATKQGITIETIKELEDLFPKKNDHFNIQLSSDYFRNNLSNFNFFQAN